MTERVAIIDLGSNSVRLIIMNIYHNSAYNLVYHQKEAIRLSEGLDQSGCLQPPSMERTLAVLRLFSHHCRMYQADKVLGLATAAVRQASNGEEFLQKVNRETGFSFVTIDGLDEARLGYLGTINTINVQDAVLFDLGGASLELTLIKNRQAVKSISLPFGAVNTTEHFRTGDRISDSQLHEMRSFILSHFKKLPWLENVSLPLVGIGGTARNIAKMDQRRKNYPFPKLHNYRLGGLAFDELWKQLVKSGQNQRMKLPGLSQDRTDLIVAGSTIIKTLMEFSGGSQLIISGCGLREGAFFEYYLARENQPLVVPDILEHSTQNMLLFYKGDTAHAHHVAALAETLFDGWRELHKLGTRERTLLRVAALLHDIGITINYYDHARHTAYLVENARLFGLTHREQMLCAVVAGWHGGISSKLMRNRLYGEFLDEFDWHNARKMALLLALAESLDVTQSGFIKKINAKLTKDGAAKLTTYTHSESVIEKHSVSQHLRWFKKEFKTDLILDDRSMNS